MASLHVKSLFTKITLEKTLSTSCDSLFSNEAKVNNINRIDYEKLLRQLDKTTFLNFKGKIYKQIDGVVMKIC